MSRKASKKAALAAFKSARSSALDTFDDHDDSDEGQRGHRSKLDRVTFAEPEDVYETMDEEQYREYVERKRQREDFVVDDGESLEGPISPDVVASSRAPAKPFDAPR